MVQKEDLILCKWDTELVMRKSHPAEIFFIVFSLITLISSYIFECIALRHVSKASWF